MISPDDRIGAEPPIENPARDASPTPASRMSPLGRVATLLGWEPHNLASSSGDGTMSISETSLLAEFYIDHLHFSPPPRRDRSSLPDRAILRRSACSKEERSLCGLHEVVEKAVRVIFLPARTNSRAAISPAAPAPMTMTWSGSGLA